MNHNPNPNSRQVADQNSIASRTCAVIVTYNPDAALSERVRLLACQLAAVIVIDNASELEHSARLQSLSRIANVTVLQNDTNWGLAAALNQGARWAKEQGFEWTLLLDQDSTPLDSMVAELAQISHGLGQEARAALLGSNFVDVNSGRAWLNPADHPNRSWVDAKSMTTSGTLIPLSAFDVLGPFRSDLFVDLVDMEFGLRARSQGYRLIISVRPLMLHTVGAKRKRRFFWRTVWPSHHSAQRRYYMARNLTLLVREYGPNDPKWALHNVLALAKSLLLVVLFEDSRLSKLTFTGRGIIAGLRRIMAGGQV